MFEAVKNIPPTRTSLVYIPITMNGGNLSVSKSNTTDTDLVIGSINFNASGGKSPVFNLKTNTLNYNLSHPFKAENVYIMGMKVPACEHGYYWQTVPVGENSYTVLACNMTNCPNPQDEENCLHQPGKFWNTSNAPNSDCACDIGDPASHEVNH